MAMLENGSASDRNMEPAAMPVRAGMMERHPLLTISCSPKMYVNDLSEKLMPSTLT